MALSSFKAGSERSCFALSCAELSCSALSGFFAGGWPTLGSSWFVGAVGLLLEVGLERLPRFGILGERLLGSVEVGVRGSGCSTL